MKTAYFLYKCRLCGTEYSQTDCSETNAAAFLIQAIKGISSPIELTTTHLCNAPHTNKMGVADLIGYTIKE